jgi:uncharacterized glyoxalase superfamily protein PhnB
MTSIEPELWVERASDAIAFYAAAFDATVLHRVGDRDDRSVGVVAGSRRARLAAGSDRGSRGT